MAFGTNNLCCDLTGCITRTATCAGDITIGADSTIYIASLCAIASFAEFDCANAAGSGIAEIVMNAGPNDSFFSYNARDEGLEGTITGTRNDNGTYTGTNTIVGEYYGWSSDINCRIKELKGAEVVVISCLNDGTSIVFGLDGSFVLSDWNFTFSTGITTLTFTENNAQLPKILDTQLPAVPTYADLDAQIAAIATVAC